MDALSKAKQLGEILKKTGQTVSVAESCTGGLLASSITDIAGSSSYFNLGFVTYSNEQKIARLNVDPMTVKNNSAVSQEVVAEMLDGLSKLSKTDICLATTGYAGPDGGTELDPVGTVYMGISINGKKTLFKQKFSGNRKDVKNRAVYFILDKLLILLKGE